MYKGILKKGLSLTVAKEGEEKMYKGILKKGLSLTVAIIFAVSNIAQAAPVSLQQNQLRPSSIAVSAVVPDITNSIKGSLTPPEVKKHLREKITGIKQRSQQPVLIFDVDDTILIRKGDNFERNTEMCKTFADLLKNDYKVVICSGNARKEQEHRITTPLIKELGAQDALEKVDNLIMYVNGGATKVTFKMTLDRKGEQNWENLVDDIPEPGKVVKAIRIAVRKVLKDNFGYGNLGDEINKEIENALKRWLREEDFLKLSDEIENDKRWYGRADFGQYIKFRLNYLSGGSFDVDSVDVAEIADRVYGKNKDVLKLSLPWIENRDNVQLCVKLIPDLKGLKDKNGMKLGDKYKGTEIKIDDVKGRIIPEIKEELRNSGIDPDSLYINPGGFSSIDINTANFNKKDAIEELFKPYGMSIKNAIYFGNEFYRKKDESGKVTKQGNDTPVLKIDGLAAISVDEKKRDPIGLDDNEKKNLMWLGEGPAALQGVLEKIAGVTATKSFPAGEFDGKERPKRPGASSIFESADRYYEQAKDIIKKPIAPDEVDTPALEKAKQLLNQAINETGDFSGYETLADTILTGDMEARFKLQRAQDIVNTIERMLIARRTQELEQANKQLVNPSALLIDKTAPYAGQIDLAKETGQVEKVQKKYGCEIIEFNPKEDDVVAMLKNKGINPTMAIAISTPASKDMLKKAKIRSIDLKGFEQGLYLDLISLAGFAKAMLYLAISKEKGYRRLEGKLRNLAQLMYKNLTGGKQALTEDMINNYMANFVITLVLPTPKVKYTQEQLRELHQSAAEIAEKA